jgi:ribonucleotide monophosphatase NagD (HAD superfamily)
LATYTYVDASIRAWITEIHNEDHIPKDIYMVGDNPTSDIIGGNMYGGNTCLVRTGVFQGKPGENDVYLTMCWRLSKTAVRKQLGKEFKLK